MSKSVKKFIVNVLPWLITVAALYYAFRDIDWKDLFGHLKQASSAYVFAALLCTCLSYCLRAYRWPYLFPRSGPDATSLRFLDSFRVLILGFFMNNILPARTGEFVRAHMGAVVTGKKRTLVLATVAAERLADGLMLSFMFVLCALGQAPGQVSSGLMWVAALFVIVGVGVVAAIAMRNSLFALIEKISAKFQHKASSYAAERLQIFINGLKPLCTIRTFPILALLTLIIWGVELVVYTLIMSAFSIPVDFAHSVLFLVAVNFSSLVPAAPGGLGIIEAAGTQALVSVGIPKEQALSMVLVQHFIQYLVVGIPGAIVMLSSSKFSWSKATAEDND